MRAKMERTECERLLAEKMAEIEEIYHSYNPHGKYLSLSLCRNKDGNDNGEWRVMCITVNNTYWKDDKRKPCNFSMWKPIKDKKYWTVMSEEDDAELSDWWDNKVNDWHMHQMGV